MTRLPESVRLLSVPDYPEQNIYNALLITNYRDFFQWIKDRILTEEPTNEEEQWWEKGGELPWETS